jgi:hypothetical protein
MLGPLEVQLAVLDVPVEVRLADLVLQLGLAGDEGGAPSALHLRAWGTSNGLTAFIRAFLARSSSVSEPSSGALSRRSAQNGSGNRIPRAGISGAIRSRTAQGY